MTVKNNLMISTNNSVVFNRVTTQTATNNIGMTIAQATSAGYIANGTYPYYKAGGVTCGAGSNLSSLAASIPSTTISDAAAAALSDTTLGVQYDATTHRVVGPNRTPKLRGATWDVGAYQIDDTSLSSPNNFRFSN